MSRASMFRLLRHPAALAALVAMVPHAGVLLGLTRLYFEDHARFHAPMLGLAAEELRAGRLPLWNAYAGLGGPLLAERGSLAAYPAVWLACLLPSSHALGVVLILQLGILAAGAAALLTDLDTPPTLAVAGGSVLGLCGPAVSWLDNAPYLIALSFLPAALLFARRLALAATPAGVRFAALGLGLAGGLAALGGDLPGAALVGVVAAAFHVSEGGRRVGRLAAAATVALIVGAGAWIPTLWSLPLSDRGAGVNLAEAGGWSLHPAELVGLVWPNPLGLPLPRYSFWPMAWHGERLFVHSLYASATLATVALAGLRGGARPARLMAAASLVIFLLASGSTTPLWAVTGRLFAFVRYPSKLAPYGVVLLALAGALGLARALARPRSLLPTLWIGTALSLVGALVGPLLIGALARTAGAQPEAVGPAQTALVIACLRAGGAAVGIALVFVLATKGRIGEPRAALAIGLLLVADPLANAEILSWTAPADGSPPRPAYLPVVEPWGPRVMRTGEVGRGRLPINEETYLVEMARQDVVLQPARNLSHHTAVLDGYGLYLLDIARGYADIIARDPIALAEVTGSDLLLAAPRRPAAWLTRGVSDGRLLPQGALRAGPTVFAVPNRLPRAFLATSATVVPRGEEAARIGAGEGRLGPLLSAGQALVGGRVTAVDVTAAAGGVASAPAPVSAVTPTEWAPAGMRFEVAPASPALLVLLDAWTAGWRAFVDGRETPILRANLLGRAVAVPAGRHVVRFEHRPLILVVAVWTSWSALAAAAAALGWLRWRRGRETRAPGGVTT